MSTDYGHWPLVVINSLIFIIFAFSFVRPKTTRDWRSFGGFSAFLLALFTEMYGFPLTMYLLSGWLTRRFPGMDVFSHNSGHLWEDIFGGGGDPHFGLFHIISAALIIGGFVLLSSSWRILHRAQREHALATTGPYVHVRHPQYAAFVIIMLGFLFQWPTIITIIMFPVLIVMYVRLAKYEEAESEKIFGEQWEMYARATPAFVPFLFHSGSSDHRAA